MPSLVEIGPEDENVKSLQTDRQTDRQTDKGRTDGQTDGQTDDGRQVIRKAHLSLSVRFVIGYFEMKKKT